MDYLSWLRAVLHLADGCPPHIASIRGLFQDPLSKEAHRPVPPRRSGAGGVSGKLASPSLTSTLIRAQSPSKSCENRTRSSRTRRRSDVTRARMQAAHHAPTSSGALLPIASLPPNPDTHEKVRPGKSAIIDSFCPSLPQHINQGRKPENAILIKAFPLLTAQPPSRGFSGWSAEGAVRCAGLPTAAGAPPPPDCESRLPEDGQSA